MSRPFYAHPVTKRDSLAETGDVKCGASDADQASPSLQTADTGQMPRHIGERLLCGREASDHVCEIIIWKG